MLTARASKIKFLSVRRGQEADGLSAAEISLLTWAATRTAETRGPRMVLLLMALAQVVVFGVRADPGVQRAGGEGVSQLKVAVAQPLVVPGDVKRNIQNMQPMVAEAARRGAELIVFSECGINGCDLNGVGKAAAISLDDPALEQVARMARKHRIAIVAGLYEKQRDHVFNTAAVFFPDGRRVIQRKHKVDLDAVKARAESAERQPTYFEVKGFRCAILICSDAGIPGVFDELATNRCDAAIVITAGAGSDTMGFHQSELANPERRKKYLDLAVSVLSRESLERCLMLHQALIACNQAGWDARSGYFHPGHSSVTDRTGEVTALIPIRFVFEHLRPDLAVGLITRPINEQP